MWMEKVYYMHINIILCYVEDALYNTLEHNHNVIMLW